MEKTYNQWTFAKQSTISSKRVDNFIFIIDYLTTKFIYKLQANIWVKVTILTITKDKYYQFCRQKNFYRRGKQERRENASINS